MVGTCSNCNRPWYSPGDYEPAACKGCGAGLRDGADSVAVAEPATGAEAIVARVNAGQDRRAGLRDNETLGRYLLFAGGVALAAAAAWAVETYQFKKTAVRTSGTVAHATEWQSKRGTRVLNTVEYYAGGGRHTVTVSGSLNGSVPLLVSRTDPTDARSPGNLWTNKIAVGVIGGILLAFGLVLRPRRTDGGESPEDSGAAAPD